MQISPLRYLRGMDQLLPQFTAAMRLTVFVSDGFDLSTGLADFHLGFCQQVRQLGCPDLLDPLTPLTLKGCRDRCLDFGALL